MPISKDFFSKEYFFISCAFGFFLKRIENQFRETYGADISEFTLKEAKKQTTHTKYNLLDLNKDNLSYPDNYFDLITAFDVLEHTDSVENSLKKIIPKLKKRLGTVSNSRFRWFFSNFSRGAVEEIP